MAGQSADARRLLEELGELAAHRYVPSRCFALIHLGLGEKARALEWLEAGVLARDMGLCALKAHPAYNDLRGEPRFQAILRQIKLAPAALMSHGVWTRNV
jgi:hypothetical protein